MDPHRTNAVALAAKDGAGGGRPSLFGVGLAQLHLPGLHYDEAKEAGLNAMEMLQRQDVHAFRSSGLQIGTLFLPLMVQDYIGALNVYLALPLLAIFGVTVPALRLLGVLCGLATMLLVWALGNELSSSRGIRRKSKRTPQATRISLRRAGWEQPDGREQSPRCCWPRARPSCSGAGKGSSSPTWS